MAVIRKMVFQGTRSLQDDKIEGNVRFEDEDGNLVPVEGTSLAEMTLDGLEEGTDDPIEEEDTILEALAKLQAQIDALAT